MFISTKRTIVLTFRNAFHTPITELLLQRLVRSLSLNYNTGLKLHNSIPWASLTLPRIYFLLNPLKFFHSHYGCLYIYTAYSLYIQVVYIVYIYTVLLSTLSCACGTLLNLIYMTEVLLGKLNGCTIRFRWSNAGASKLRPVGQLRPVKPFHPARGDILSIIKKEENYKSLLIWQFVTYSETKTLRKMSGLRTIV